MKRKISLVILTAALALASTIGLTACGDDQTKPCAEHTWDGGNVTREATCAEAGETTYTCTVCGETKTEPIAKSTTHSWDAGEVDQPDITVEGSITYTCTVCGDTYSETVPAHVEHEWDEGSQLEAPTCTEKGSMKYECKICHKTKTEDIPATGEHRYDTFVEYETEPTCGTAGSATYKCTTCTETTTKEVQPTGVHSLSWCHEGDQHWQKCANCDYATDKEAHVWTETAREEATLYQTGSRHKECSVCDYTSVESYELDNFVSDYRSGIVLENTSGWEYGHSDYKWNTPSTEDRLPGNMGDTESFVFTKSEDFNDDAWLVKNNTHEVISEIKAGWLNGSWSTLAYTVGVGVANASYTLALGYKYNPADSHKDLYTAANVRIAVLSQDRTCKYSEFIHLDGHGTNEAREISGLNTCDKIYVFIEFEEAKEKETQSPASKEEHSEETEKSVRKRKQASCD